MRLAHRLVIKYVSFLIDRAILLLDALHYQHSRKYYKMESKFQSMLSTNHKNHIILHFLIHTIQDGGIVLIFHGEMLKTQILGHMGKLLAHHNNTPKTTPTTKHTKRE